MNENEYCSQLKAQTKALYDSIGTITCPYFEEEEINFNSDGFHHFQYTSGGTERLKKAQIRRYKTFRFAPHILKKAGTVQQHRKMWGPVGRRKGDGLRATKIIEDWCFTALIPSGPETYIDVKIIVRRIGTGPLHFYSVMPFKAPDHLAKADPE